MSPAAGRDVRRAAKFANVWKAAKTRVNEKESSKGLKDFILCNIQYTLYTLSDGFQ